MAVKLILRNRKSSDEVNMPLAALTEMLKKSDSEFADSFRRIVENKDGSIHDKRWLELIAGHGQQEGGIAVDDLWSWMPLRVKINKLDIMLDGKQFTLSDDQSQLFKKRLKDKNFKIGVLPPQFAEFLLHFCEMAKWSPDESEKTTWVDLDEEEEDKPVVDDKKLLTGSEA